MTKHGLTAGGQAKLLGSKICITFSGDTPTYLISMQHILFILRIFPPTPNKRRGPNKWVGWDNCFLLYEKQRVARKKI